MGLPKPPQTARGAARGDGGGAAASPAESSQEGRRGLGIPWPTRGGSQHPGRGLSIHGGVSASLGGGSASGPARTHRPPKPLEAAAAAAARPCVALPAWPRPPRHAPALATPPMGTRGGVGKDFGEGGCKDLGLGTQGGVRWGVGLGACLGLQEPSQGVKSFLGGVKSFLGGKTPPKMPLGGSFPPKGA